MMDSVVAYGDYMPHGMCLLWQPWLVLLWAGSDLLIFLSYTAIPIALFLVLRKRTEVPHSGLVALFASFILLCGLTHLSGIVTLWYPIYPFVGWLKLATGVVSLATAIVLFRLIPDLIRLPSPAALEAANENLRAEVEAHKATVASLDRQVRERTQELEEATALVAVQAREAVHRSGNLLAVVHSLASQSAKRTRLTEEFLDSFLGRVRALSKTTRAIAESERSSVEIREVVKGGLDLLKVTFGQRIHVAGPDLIINPVAAQQLSLVLYELGTNTQKYGLGRSDDARVSVRWAIGEGEFEFEWCESQIEAGDDPPREGFGTTLLTRIAPGMLRGQAERVFYEGGMIYRLVAPLDAVQAGKAHDRKDWLADEIIEESFGPG